MGEPITTTSPEWQMLVQMVSEIRTETGETRKFITGNGDMEQGLLFRVTMLEKTAQAQAENRKEHKDDFKRIVYPVVTDVLKVTIGGGFAAFLVSKVMGM